MAKCWGTELKARHIRVNVVSPGTTPIEGSMKGMYELEQKQFIQLFQREYHLVELELLVSWATQLSF